jgi:hypothetical protein
LHSRASLPAPALSVHEQLGLQQSQYLEAKPVSSKDNAIKDTIINLYWIFYMGNK